MCRLFAYKSNQKFDMISLTEGEKSFMNLSQAHPDGWGIAQYIDNVPHVIKSDTTAMNDQLFQKVCDRLNSRLVIAHLRKATLGNIDFSNAHPFQMGRWVFAHNGNIKGFNNFNSELLSQIPGHLSRFSLGETDSEVIFFHILGTIDRLYGWNADISIQQLITAVKQSIDQITKVIGPFSINDGPPTETYLTFIISNGDLMLSHHGGKPLLYANDRLAINPERSKSRRQSNNEVERLVFSSEKIPNQNIWQPMVPGLILGIDDDMNQLQDSSLEKLADPVA